MLEAVIDSPESEHMRVPDALCDECKVRED